MIAVFADDTEGRRLPLIYRRGTRMNNRILADPAESFDLIRP
jgi:hypothetical protein